MRKPPAYLAKAFPVLNHGCEGCVLDADGRSSAGRAESKLQPMQRVVPTPPTRVAYRHPSTSIQMHACSCPRGDRGHLVSTCLMSSKLFASEACNAPPCWQDNWEFTPRHHYFDWQVTCTTTHCAFGGQVLCWDICCASSSTTLRRSAALPSGTISSAKCSKNAATWS